MTSLPDPLAKGAKMGGRQKLVENEAGDRIEQSLLAASKSR